MVAIPKKGANRPGKRTAFQCFSLDEEEGGSDFPVRGATEPEDDFQITPPNKTCQVAHHAVDFQL